MQWASLHPVASSRDPWLSVPPSQSLEGSGKRALANGIQEGGTQRLKLVEDTLVPRAGSPGSLKVKNICMCMPMHKPSAFREQSSLLEL